ncbi:MAG: asparagine synthase (glutamine-hydrolyzing) [Bacteroidota bacterium]
MCGINGIYSFNNRVSDAAIRLKKMNDSIVHRGPDAEGIFIEKNIALGHRRLSIIDVSKNANQPLYGLNSRYVLVFNGEIYNFKELKTKLDYPFETNSDSEVIIAAYHKWGEKCVDHFNGMFAFAIWDSVKEKLFIARDRLGIKPLYFYRDNEMFIFSSQIKGILSSGLVEAKLNRKQLSNYLKFQTIYSPDTILKDVNLLESGSCICIDKNGIRKEKYWKINSSTKNLSTESYPAIKKNIKELLSNSVDKRMVSDVPFGAFLSGGIDSGLMVALMSEVSSGPVNTFNINFLEKDFSESVYAENIAKRYNTNHTEIKLSPNDLLAEIDDALSFMDSPSADGINTYVVSKHTREHGIKMAVSGLGGDELFAGYPQFKQAHFLDKIKYVDKIPLSLRRIISKTISSSSKTELNKVSKWLQTQNWNINELYPTFRQQATDDEISKLLNTSFESKITYYDKSSLLNNLSVNEIDTYLQHILLRDSDQMSMASSLEVRVPFMDHELVEYVLSIPDKHKYPSSPKKLLTDSFPGILTPDIVNRKKMGFVFPWDNWLRNELRNFVEENLRELENFEEFNYAEVYDLWIRFLKGDRSVYWTRIWGLVVLAYWLKNINKQDFKL